MGDGTFILTARKGPPFGEHETTEVTTTHIPGRRGGVVDLQHKLFKESDGKEIVFPGNDDL